MCSCWLVRFLNVKLTGKQASARIVKMWTWQSDNFIWTKNKVNVLILPVYNRCTISYKWLKAHSTIFRISWSWSMGLNVTKWLSWHYYCLIPPWFVLPSIRVWSKCIIQWRHWHKFSSRLLHKLPWIEFSSPCSLIHCPFPRICSHLVLHTLVPAAYSPLSMLCMDQLVHSFLLVGIW